MIVSLADAKLTGTDEQIVKARTFADRRHIPEKHQDEVL
jgi:hypothetical protein